MPGSRSRRVGGPAILAAPVVAAAGVYLAERIAVARWSRADERFVDEPVTVAGDERFIDSVDGVRLRVVEAGHGPPVVLAHGFTATADQWAPVATRLLDRGLRVIAYDQRGHGESTSGNGRFRPADLGRDLAAVLRATAPDGGAVLVGHSMGGMGVQAFLADHEDRHQHLGGVVLVATLARSLDVPFGHVVGRIGGSSLVRRLMAQPTNGRVLARPGVGASPANLVLDVIRNGWATSSDRTRAGVLRDLADFDYSAALPTIEVPTTVIAGELDRVTPYDENRRIAELLGNATLDTLPGIGHSVHWEAPDRVVEAVAAYSAQ